MKVGIIGAGIVGRLLAWHLCQQKIQVHLFDKDNVTGKKACSWIAAGMISPVAERAILPKFWYQMGLKSLEWWPKIIASLALPVFYQQNGTVVVCHSQQKGLLTHFIDCIKKAEPTLSLPFLPPQSVTFLEPELTSLVGCFLPFDAWINPTTLFKALTHYLLTRGVKWHTEHFVKDLSSNGIQTDKGQFAVDRVFDCRGLGAKTHLPELRSVHGEIIFCQSKNIHLQHAIRFLHARFPCYIVPQGNGIYAIGATQTENNDQKNVRVQSAMELLSAAVAVHPGFRDANILSLYAKGRPTTVSHTPLVLTRNGITHINGMFRHGFLLAPALTAEIAANLGVST